MSDVVVEFASVSKAFRNVDALRGLTLTVPRGSVLGLLGRNGAGKSTAMRCLVGLQQVDDGIIRVLGQEPLNLDVAMRQRICYVADDGVPFPRTTAASLIRLCAPLYPRWDRVLEEQMLGRFQIDPRRKLKELSQGQQRAVALLLALCPRPELLVLDEPMANLDPVVRREFLDTILTLVGGEDRTVILSSHLLFDVERVADRIAILDQGRVLLAGLLDDIKDRARRLRFIFEGPAPQETVIPGCVAFRRSGREVLVTVVDYDEAATARLAISLGARVEAYNLPLEELFIDLVGDNASTPRSAA